MLDKSALSQLQTLKQEIHDSIPRFEGKVRATTGRFGFVVTDESSFIYRRKKWKKYYREIRSLFG